MRTHSHATLYSERPYASDGSVCDVRSCRYLLHPHGELGLGLGLGLALGLVFSIPMVSWRNALEKQENKMGWILCVTGLNWIKHPAFRVNNSIWVTLCTYIYIYIYYILDGECIDRRDGSLFWFHTLILQLVLIPPWWLQELLHDGRVFTHARTHALTRTHAHTRAQTHTHART